MLKRAAVIIIDDVFKIEKYEYVVNNKEEWITLYFFEGKKRCSYTVRENSDQVIKLENNKVKVFSLVEKDNLCLNLYDLVPFENVG